MHRNLVVTLVGVLFGTALVLGEGSAKAEDMAYIEGDPGDSLITVTPSGLFPTDHENVQWAVDHVAEGRTVLLTEGEFNFGTSGSVAVSRSLTLRGGDAHGIDIATGEGTWPTKIRGGRAAITVAAGEDDTVNINSLQLGLDGDPNSGPVNAGIRVVSGYDVKVTGCKVIYVAMDPVHFATITGGIFVAGTLSNKVVIDGNVLMPRGRVEEFQVPEPTPFPPANHDVGDEHGVIVARVDAEVRVTNNHVESIRDGIELVYCGGVKTIADNTVVVRAAWEVVPWWGGFGGAIVGYANDGLTYIRGNDIAFIATRRSTGALGYAIFVSAYDDDVEAPGGAISDNHIVLMSDADAAFDPDAGIMLGGYEKPPTQPPSPDPTFGRGAHNWKVTDNTLQGVARYGIQLSPLYSPLAPSPISDGTCTSSNNEFVANDLSGLEATEAQVSIGSHGDTYPYPSNNVFKDNKLGGGGEVVIACGGNDNDFFDGSVMGTASYGIKVRGDGNHFEGIDLRDLDATEKCILDEGTGNTFVDLVPESCEP